MRLVPAACVATATTTLAATAAWAAALTTTLATTTLAATHATELLAHVFADGLALILIDLAVLVLVDAIEERLLLLGWQTFKNALHAAHSTRSAALPAIAATRKLFELFWGEKGLQTLLIALANSTTVIHCLA